MKSNSTVNQDMIALVKRAQGGDQDAYTQLFNEYHQHVLSYIYHTLHDRHAAEDVAQEAFIKAHRSLGQLGPPWDFKSWVFRIASNLAIDYLRAGKRIVNVEDEVMAYLEDPPSTRRPYERRLQREEQKTQVWRSLDGLPTHYRQALVLHEFNELSYREVAQALEVSYDNARQIVHRARTKFQELHGLKMAAAQAAERCRELGDLLSAFHDGELEGDQANKVREHLRTCERCQQEREGIKAAGLVLAGLPPLAASEAWKASVLEAVKARSVVERSPATAPRPPGGDSPAAGGGSGAGSAGGGGISLASMIAGGAPWLIGAILFIGAVAAAGVLLARTLDLGFEPAASATSMVLTPEAGPADSGGLMATEESEINPAAEVPFATATATSTPSPSPTMSYTPTLGPPMAKALENSTCRFGPSAEQFEAAGYLLTGESVPIDGRSSADTYWWVVQPDGSGHCYIWKQLVEASGDLASVPFVQDPPTPTPPDEDPPSVSVSHSPSGSGRPNNQDVVTFSAQASDEGGIARIEIWVKGPSDNVPQLIRSCQDSTNCQAVGGPYNGGEIRYFARASDQAGNEAESNTSSIKITLIVK